MHICTPLYKFFVMHIFLHHGKKTAFTDNAKNKKHFDKQLYKLGQRSGNQYPDNQFSSLLHLSLPVINKKHIGEMCH